MTNDSLPRELADDEYAICQLYWDRGEHVPWRRVYRDGRDVTDEDPTRWPWPWRDTGRSSRSRAYSYRRG